MKANNIGASQSAYGTNSKTIPNERTNQLSNFIITNSQSLKDEAYRAYPNLNFLDCEKVIAALAKRLNRYAGPPEQPAFLKWAIRFVSKETQRYRILAEILAEHSPLIHKAIHECLWTSAEDLAIEHSDIYWEVIFLIFQRAHSLAKKSKAKLSTRLWSLVKKHIFFYYNPKRARRLRCMRRKPTIACEHLSEAEIAALQAEETEMKINIQNP